MQVEYSPPRIVTLFKDVHPEKIPSEVPPTVAVTKLSQPAKALRRMVVVLVSTRRSFLHPLKAASPMTVTVEGEVAGLQILALVKCHRAHVLTALGHMRRLSSL